jgi:hypothetical protein
MYDCEVAGQTDFFYGFGTCWVTNSEVTLRGCGGGITAWKGMLRSETNWLYTLAFSPLLGAEHSGCYPPIKANTTTGTNTTFENKYGVYIQDSVVQKANSSLEIEGECALGRPWNALHRSIFANTYLDDSIRPSGYIEWGATDPRVNLSMLLKSLYCQVWFDTDPLQIPPWPSTTLSGPVTMLQAEPLRPMSRSS